MSQRSLAIAGLVWAIALEFAGLRAGPRVNGAKDEN